MSDERDNYRRLWPSDPPRRFARPSKCGACNGTGFASSIPMSGRICGECRGSGEEQQS
jgi:DnaJ-class molecular chaperone